MKKCLFFIALSLLMTSCVTQIQTARTESVPYSMYNATTADLEVGPRVSYTMSPSKAVQRGGLENCKQAAINECLAKNGNADMILDAEFVIEHKNFFIFSTQIKSVTVTGRPAVYKNFRSMPDDVWTDPVFRGVKNASTVKVFEKNVKKILP